jgi:hypothetical protein
LTKACDKGWALKDDRGNKMMISTYGGRTSINTW